MARPDESSPGDRAFSALAIIIKKSGSTRGDCSMIIRVWFSGLLARRALTAVLLMSAATEAASQVPPPTPLPQPLQSTPLATPPAPCPSGTALVANMHTFVTVGSKFITYVMQLPLPANCKFVLTATATVVWYSGRLECSLYSLPSKTAVSERIIVEFPTSAQIAMPITVIGADATGGDTIALGCSDTYGMTGGQAQFTFGAISAVSASTLTIY